MRKYKLEVVGRSNIKPIWYDSEEELNATLELLKGCPIDDGPAEVKITEYSPTSVRRVQTHK